MSGRFEGETDPRALNAPILEFDPTREAIRPLLPDGVMLAGEEGFEPSIS
jgi:hypothetical protein